VYRLKNNSAESTGEIGNDTQKLINGDMIMKKSDLRALIAVPLVILIAVAVSLAGSQGGVTVFGFPLFAWGVTLAFILQWIAFVFAYILKTEKFYDLTGSITYILVVTLTVIFNPLTDGRAYLLMGMVILWAVRLGSFLFLRIRAAGEDRRFREIKVSFSRFLLAWTMQGLWVTFALAAALVVLTSNTRIELGILALVGFLVWLFGFSIEIIADRQKSAFKADPLNEGKFINVGLWSWSRHPNYFGEIILWIGVAIIALPVLNGWQWITLISPIFVIVLLTRISGIPMLEKRADEKWGGQEAYEAYKTQTPVLIPKPPSGRK
jgi:steroid 5-alpha reductase family enzyme